MQNKDYHTQNQFKDQGLSTVGFPSDYFTINPLAPKLINIDVLNMLTRNSMSLIMILIKDYESKNTAILSHRDIIETSFMVDDYILQAIQVVKQGYPDSDLIRHFEKALSILSLIQQDGEALSSGFSLSDFRIKEAFKATHDILDTAHKAVDSIPDHLTGYTKKVA